jgi:uncharacterized protein (TIGR02996 family)
VTDGEALLATILARPADDGVRLVYADWLDENGQPERAEFVRVQVAIAQLEASEPQGKDAAFIAGYRSSLHRNESVMCAVIGGQCRCILCLQAREGELLNGKGWQLWQDECHRIIPPGAHIPSVITFGRGFIESVTCTAADWLQHGDAIRAAHPVTWVRLTTWPMIEYSAHQQRLRGDTKWFHNREATDEVGRHLTTGGDPFAFTDAHVLLRLRWPGVTFEPPPH